MTGEIMRLYFNPLHHEGGDIEMCIAIAEGRISIHSTTRVETVMTRALKSLWIFQSTPPRGWRRKWQECR